MISYHTFYRHAIFINTEKKKIRKKFDVSKLAKRKKNIIFIFYCDLVQHLWASFLITFSNKQKEKKNTRRKANTTLY